MAKTYSRYDFMEASNVADEITGSYYPDPLSINYLDLEVTSIPMKDKMNDSKIESLWREAEFAYGSAKYDDIVLTVNGYSHKNFLVANDIVYFPAAADIESSYAKEK